MLRCSGGRNPLRIIAFELPKLTALIFVLCLYPSSLSLSVPLYALCALSLSLSPCPNPVAVAFTSRAGVSSISYSQKHLMAH